MGRPAGEKWFVFSFVTVKLQKASSHPRLTIFKTCGKYIRDGPHAKWPVAVKQQRRNTGLFVVNCI